MRNVLIIVTLIIWAGIVFAQGQDVQLGRDNLQQFKNNVGALYDYSDPQSVNIKVAVWGFVKFPGRYIVPVNTKVSDLLSLAGGPVSEARVDEFRLVRTNSDSSQSVINLNYNDFLYNTDVSKINNTLTLKAGDILLATGGPPRMFFRDYFSIGISIVSLLLSVIILVRQG